jgi:hypothetical protein
MRDVSNATFTVCTCAGEVMKGVRSTHSNRKARSEVHQENDYF